jgi:hypothetical protein
VRLDLRVVEHGRQLVDVVERTDDVLELLADDVETVLVTGCVEQRAGVDAVRDGYERLASSCEKSISARASSISRVWS